jgi:hypothetical protein
VRQATVVLLSVLIGVAGNFKALGANSSGPTKPLAQAASDGDIEQLKLHLAAGSNFNAPDSYGITPLKRVIEAQHPEAALLIIASGKADVNAKDRAGKTPLMMAVMLSTGAKDVVAALLAKGADVNAKDSFDGTALHAAVMMNNKDIVEMLVAKGADANVAARNGQTPYMMAIQPPGRPEIAEILQQHGGVAPQLSEGSPYGNAPMGGAAAGPGGPGAPMVRAALHIDPNEIQKKMMQFQGLAEAVKKVDDKSANEQHAWIQRRTDNRTSLLFAEEQQFTDELAFVKPIAVQEKAVKTVKAIDDLGVKRKERSGQIMEQLREQRRAALIQSRQSMTGGAGMAGARGMRGMRGQPQNNMGAAGYPGAAPYAGGSAYNSGSNSAAARGAVANQPPIDPNTQAQIDAWSNAKPEDKRDLLQTVTDLNLSELQALDALATQEKAMKTSAAIRGLMMLREQRVEKITLGWQEEDARLQRLQALPNRGGMPGMQPQQGQMPIRGRRMR